MWRSFEKAGIDGWKSLIPIYNIYLVVKLAGLPGWLLLGFIVPLVNIFVPVYTYYRFTRNFGKGSLFSIFTGLFPYFGVPIIGFGDASYTGNYQPEN